MSRRTKPDTQQLKLDWTATSSRPPVVPERPARWDFRSTFPAVLQEAIDAGTIDVEEAEPDRLPGLHATHGAALHQALVDLDRHHDARRRGIDPTTGKVPHRLAKRAELPTKLSYAIERLDRWWGTLLDVYAEAFGQEAATSFGRHILAAHAGMETTTRPEANAIIQPDRLRISSPG